MSLIKTEEEIHIMREAGAIAATVLARLSDEATIGMTTYDLDQLGRKYIEEMGAVSACYNYHAHGKTFPSYTCISVNEEVVHGVASMKRVLTDGDIISIDVSVVYKGYVGDNAKTIALGKVEAPVQELLDVTEKALMLGIDQARDGNRVGDISYAVQRYAEGHKFSIVREFVGHGVGKTMHEDPQIPNFGRPKKGAKLLSGMVVAIEPMVNLGRKEVEYAPDGWTVLTRDRQPSAHFEHTVLITDGAPEILTLPKK